MDQEAEIEGHAEQRETRHQHAGDGARLEGKLETTRERCRRRLGGAHIGADRDVHADEPGRPRQDRADGKTDRDIEPQEIGKQHEDDDADHSDRGVLTPQVGLCAFAHRCRDFLHARRPRIRAQHRRRRPDRVDDGKHSAEHNQP
ncbi:hypothetical protein ACVWWO_001003 [Bradyrhizobium sp. F1.13.1]